MHFRGFDPRRRQLAIDVVDESFQPDTQALDVRALWPQFLSEEELCPVKARFDVRLADAEHPSYLAGGQSFHLSQEYDDPEPRWQPAKHLAKLSLQPRLERVNPHHCGCEIHPITVAVGTPTIHVLCAGTGVHTDSTRARPGGDCHTQHPVSAARTGTDSKPSRLFPRPYA
jgi:hypothetical protein